MQGADAVQIKMYFTDILQHYMDYLNIIFGPGHKEYFLDFVQGILLNMQNKFSLRIYRTPEYRDLAVGTKNFLLEASANIIYIQQERALEYGPSSFTVPNSWETFQRQCINWKIQSSDLIYEVVPSDSIPVKNYLDKENIQVRKLMKMLKYRVDVHWPEVYLGELLAMKMTEAKMKKTMFSRTFPKSIDNLELQCSNATTVRETDEDQSRNIYSCSDMIGVKIHNATSNTSFIE
uniref:Uncharacterized protein n=1 Tax=Romanomermis culicivorax TaxID=13658 RepID=A0A915KGB1_ROMCU